MIMAEEEEEEEKREMRSHRTTESKVTKNPTIHGEPSKAAGKEKPKVVVIMGPTGSGKSRLAIDLGTHFPVEVINADSMQVYKGLDVLTNKVPLHEQKGVPHHLLGTVNPNVEFTAKEFRDCAVPLIDDILSRNCLPVIVGGTHYYIQALISPFLLDDTTEDMDDNCLNTSLGDTQSLSKLDCEGITDSYDHLKSIDPVAANRIHPNNHRKISQYLSLHARFGILPSELLQGKAAENWGRVDYFRYDCCFICMDASLPVLDQYVDQRVDCMVDTGLLDEVFDIFNLNADYTRGLLQAIGVREFETFLRENVVEARFNNESYSTDVSVSLKPVDMANKILKENMRAILNSSDDRKPRILLREAIDKVKLNTRRLVRRQRRMIVRLQKLFGWDIRVLDATESILSKSDDIWAEQVVEPAMKMVRSFLSQEAASSVSDEAAPNSAGTRKLGRELWTQYVCKGCGDKVLRGAHEWEQHIQGRSHRKRMSKLRKSQGRFVPEQQQQQHRARQIGDELSVSDYLSCPREGGN